jgi:hypothetical protein
MFCNHCDSPLKVGAKFCSNCGKPFIKDVASTINLELSQSYLTEIKHTLFIIPSNFKGEFESIAIQLKIQTPDVVFDNDHSQLINKTKQILVKAPVNRFKYICIIGGWDEVPPIYVKNNFIDDGDDYCITDSLYGATEDFNHEDPFTAVPDIPVGRIPVANKEIIIRLLTQQPKLNKNKNLFHFGVTAECWKTATHEIVSSFSNLPAGCPIEIPVDYKNSLIDKSTIMSSPDWNEPNLKDSFGSGPLEPFSILLFNVHGGADDPHWVGEGDNGYVHIFSPNTISNFNSAFLVSEACYGGAMSYETPSIVEQFFNNGGNSFVGSSTIAYGAPSKPISAADLIAKHYINGLYEGLSQGESLMRAKYEALSEDPLSIEVGLKTALSFNLYGIPWMSIAARNEASQVSEAFVQEQSQNPPSNSVLERIRSNRSSLTNRSNKISEKFRDQYRSRLPARNLRFILEKEDLLIKIRQFRDYSKIQNLVTAWGGDFQDSKLDCVSAGGEEGYRLFSHIKSLNQSKRTLILSINNNGQLVKTLSSKGVL